MSETQQETTAAMNGQAPGAGSIADAVADASGFEMVLAVLTMVTAIALFAIGLDGFTGGRLFGFARGDDSP